MIQGYRMAGPPPYGEPPQTPEGGPPERAWPPWVGFVALMSAIFVSSIAAGFLYAFAAPDPDHSPAWVDLTGALMLEAALVASAVIAATLIKPAHPWQFGLRRAPWKTIGWAILGLVAFYLLAAAWVQLVGQPEQSTAEDVGADEGGLAVIGAGVLFVVIAPICEEFFFRGFFYGSLRTRLPTVPAALVVGGVFGAIHFTSGVSAVPILIVLGVIFCLVREKTGSLYPCIGMHALNNTFAYAGQTDVSPGVAAGIGGGMLIAVALANQFAWRRQPSLT